MITLGSRLESQNDGRVIGYEKSFKFVFIQILIVIGVEFVEYLLDSAVGVHLGFALALVKGGEYLFHFFFVDFAVVVDVINVEGQVEDQLEIVLVRLIEYKRRSEQKFVQCYFVISIAVEAFK